MELFQYLQSLYPQLTPNNSKIHLASTNEYKENPIQEFVKETFDDWQCLQKLKSFNRTYVVSLIQTEDKARFLYAGTLGFLGQHHMQYLAGTKTTISIN